jgi:hypothetical protein
MENDPAKVTFLFPIRLQLFDDHQPFIKSLWMDFGQSISILPGLSAHVAQITGLRKIFQTFTDHHAGLEK